jgi:hypothetical protein
MGDIKHLYHDLNFSESSLMLDAKEKLQTREKNNREDRYLDKYKSIIDRAKTICKRRNEWDQLNIRYQLRIIKGRTPSLERGLQREMQRFRDIEEALHVAMLTGPGNKSRAVPHHGLMKGTRASQAKLTQRKVATEEQKKPIYVDTTMMRFDHRNENTSFRNRTKQITRMLHRVYVRTAHRNQDFDSISAMNKLKRETREAVMKAKVYLKYDEALDNLNDILEAKPVPGKYTRLPDILTSEDKSKTKTKNIQEYFSQFQSTGESESSDDEVEEKKSRTQEVDPEDDKSSATQEVPPEPEEPLHESTLTLVPKVWQQFEQIRAREGYREQKKTSLVTIRANYRSTQVPGGLVAQDSRRSMY